MLYVADAGPLAFVPSPLAFPIPGASAMTSLVPLGAAFRELAERVRQHLRRGIAGTFRTGLTSCAPRITFGLSGALRVGEEMTAPYERTVLSSRWNASASTRC